MSVAIIIVVSIACLLLFGLAVRESTRSHQMALYVMQMERDKVAQTQPAAPAAPDPAPSTPSLTPVVLRFGDEDFVACGVLAKTFYGHSEVADVVRMAECVLKLALARPDVVSHWIASHVRYRDLEGFPGDTALMASKIKARPEYTALMP